MIFRGLADYDKFIVLSVRFATRWKIQRAAYTVPDHSTKMAPISYRADERLLCALMCVNYIIAAWISSDKSNVSANLANHGDEILVIIGTVVDPKLRRFDLAVVTSRCLK
jgi:hypothetical protein